MKKEVKKFQLKKNQISRLTELRINGGALPTTQQSTVGEPTSVDIISKMMKQCPTNWFDC